MNPVQYLITLAGLLALSSAVLHGAEPKPSRPNILLLVADDLSRDMAQAKNIASENPERVASMRARLEAVAGRSRTKTPSE